MGEKAAAPQPAGEAKEEAANPAKGQEALARKIIHNARVELIVEDFDKARAEFFRLVKERPGAYIEKSDFQGAPGVPRFGVWTVCVPVDHFDAFLAAVSGLGELRHSSTDSQDVTNSYTEATPVVPVRSS
jgi:hypothetical protein